MLESVLILNGNLPSIAVGRNVTDAISTNTGNPYLAYSWAKIIGADPASISWQQKIWEPELDPGRIREAAKNAKHIFINLQDQLRLGLPDELYVDAFNNLSLLDDTRAPVIAFSLCANSMTGYDMSFPDSLTSSQLRFFKALGERCASIGVRGPYSGSVLEAMGIHNFEVVGCPSYFEMGRDRRVMTPEERSADLALGVTGRQRGRFFDAAHYYLQGDEDWPLIELMHTEDADWTRRQARGLTEDLNDLDLLSAALEERVHFFTSMEAWKAHIQTHCRAVVGGRLHGAIAALNAGVPAIVTNGDSRAQEACEHFGIPWLPNAFNINSRVEDIYAQADVSRINALYTDRYDTFEAWLNKNGLTISKASRFPDYPQQPRVDAATVSRRVGRALSEQVRYALIKRNQAASLHASLEAKHQNTLAQEAFLRSRLEAVIAEQAAVRSALQHELDASKRDLQAMKDLLTRAESNLGQTVEWARKTGALLDRLQGSRWWRLAQLPKRALAVWRRRLS